MYSYCIIYRSYGTWGGNSSLSDLRISPKNLRPFFKVGSNLADKYTGTR